MNLQITTPAEQCTFDCPYCIAKQHNHNNDFQNLYLTNRFAWAIRLYHVLSIGGYDSVVITGTNEPTQSENYILDTLNIIEYFNKSTNSNIKTELQTKSNTPLWYFNRFDVVAVSCDSSKQLFDIAKNYYCNFNKVLRFVLLGTKFIKIEEIYEFYRLNTLDVVVMGRCEIQFTLKKLQSGEEDNSYNQWVIKNSCDQDTIKKVCDIFKSKKISFRYDESCMDSETRYKVFREDGELYPNWGTTKHE